MNKRKFLAFERVRRSGRTNMFDINAVIDLAKRYGQTLSKPDCFDIMLHYDEYKKKYLNDNNDENDNC